MIIETKFMESKRQQVKKDPSFSSHDFCQICKHYDINILKVSSKDEKKIILVIYFRSETLISGEKRLSKTLRASSDNKNNTDHLIIY